nr:immunoglobulin light chain junction region [Macaca mulatta]
WAIGHTSGRLF